MWGNSLLLQSFCDGSFEELDFPSKVADESFDKLCMLVDEIYTNVNICKAYICSNW
jgi:hypothetical protein